MQCHIVQNAIWQLFYAILIFLLFILYFIFYIIFSYSHFSRLVECEGGVTFLPICTYEPCNYQFIVTDEHCILSQVDKNSKIAVNDRLSAIGAYLKTIIFGWILVQTRRLTGPEHLSKKEQQQQQKVLRK